MNNLWRKTVISILLCWGVAIAFPSLTKRNTIAEGLRNPTSLVGLSSSEKQAPVDSQSLLVNQKKFFCQSVNPEYQDFYQFETQNYNISICVKGEEWFYSRESKSNPDSVLILPATIVFGGEVFKAVDGKTTYFVGSNSDGYYSSVMYGKDRMIFEPELLQVPTSVGQQQEENPSSSVPVSTSETWIEQNSDLNTGYWGVCTEDRNDLHPYLNGWQKFIGKSPNLISEYASDKGYSFYNANAETGNASVETTDGLIVTLGIMKFTKTIGSVCVKPIASF
jgi:hypothetical protein